MKILLIGHSTIDHIDTEAFNSVRPGGIYYSALGISALEKIRKNIALLTGWNKSKFNLFKEIYEELDLSPSKEIEKMPEVFLETSSAGERNEKYLHLSTNLSLENIQNWKKYDGILINMITGFDISLDQLKSIRKNFSGPVYFDLHTLSRGIDENMKRNFRPVPFIKQWLSNIDILQCNESELQTIVQQKNENEGASEILDSGVKAIILTRGDRGVTLYYSNNSEIISHSLNAVRVKCENKIGCGDIFGAVFFYSYISNGNLFESLAKANYAGAIAASSKELKIDTFKVIQGE